MRNYRKTIIRVYLVLLHLVVIVGSIGLGLFWLGSAVGRGYQLGAYQQRHRECDSERLLACLEPVLGFDFPENIRDVKTAKTKSIDGSILFIVKFTAEPNTVEQFLKSFPKTIQTFKLVSYDAAQDERKICGTWPPPEWFTKQIQRGKQGRYSKDYGKLKIYIDTTNDKNSVVYMHGSSHTRI